MTKRAIIYARVSTDDQAEKGYSIPSQLEAGRKYAAQHGAAVVAELADDCSGTIPVFERPNGSELYRLVAAGAGDLVIAYTIDRVARDEDALEFLLLARHIQRAGMTFHLCDSGPVSDSPYGRIVDYAKAAGAAEERKKILERTHRGRVEKARNGKWVGGHQVPYGYKRKGAGRDARLEIEPMEAEIVRRIFYCYTGYNGRQPVPLRGIIRALNAESVAPPNRGKNGAGWYAPAVRRILARTAYLGIYEYPAYGVTVDLPELAIIEPEVWHAAQRQCERNRTVTRRQGREYLLSGHIFCTCGNRMVGEGKTFKDRPGHPDYLYYRCNQKINRVSDDRCKQPAIRADLAGERVWEWLKTILDDDNITRGIDRMNKRSQAELNITRATLGDVDDLLAKVDARIKKYMTAFGDEDDETVAAQLKATIREAVKQKEGLTRKREHLQAEIDGNELSAEQRAEVLRKVKDVKSRLADVTFAQKRYITQRLGLEATLRIDADGNRWLDCACSLTLDTRSVRLSEHSQLRAAFRTTWPRPSPPLAPAI